MMSKNYDFLKVFTDEGSSSTKLPTLSTSTDLSDACSVNLFDYFHITQIADGLKPIIEGYILNYYFKHFRSGIGAEENPFDEIYISKLLPDEVTSENIQHVNKFMYIKDLSDSITFDDGFDD